ncbi:hypothetical protein DPMN_027508 [Dreissena polymorpha]|nr:hypothetical protein DPMN_027508 [Dreissena polymorpha]
MQGPVDRKLKCMTTLWHHENTSTKAPEDTQQETESHETDKRRAEEPQQGILEGK